MQTTSTAPMIGKDWVFVALMIASASCNCAEVSFAPTRPPRPEAPRNDPAQERHPSALLRRRHDRRRQNHHLARDGNDGALKRHQPKDSGVTAGQDPVEPNFNEMMHGNISDLGF